MSTHREALEQILKVMGPEVPSCSGCEAEWSEALRIARDALDDSSDAERMLLESVPVTDEDELLRWIRPLVPVGWALVPVVPTQEQRAAFQGDGDHGYVRTTIFIGDFDTRYAAMLAAAPEVQP